MNKSSFFFPSSRNVWCFSVFTLVCSYNLEVSYSRYLFPHHCHWGNLILYILSIYERTKQILEGIDHSYLWQSYLGALGEVLSWSDRIASDVFFILSSKWALYSWSNNLMLVHEAKIVKRKNWKRINFCF
jgi:hypothetical protein